MKISGLGMTVGITVLWVLLWGSASPANILSGIAVGVLLALVIPGVRAVRPNRTVVRPVAALRLVLYMLGNAVRSNVALTREIVTRDSSVRTGVIGVQMLECSDEVVTVVVNMLALTPGTMPIDVIEDPRTVYVHILRLHDLEEARREIQYLAALAVDAFGTEVAVASIPDSWRHRR